MRIIREECHQQQQRGHAQEDADDIIEAMRLGLRCCFASHGASLVPSGSHSKVKLDQAKMRGREHFRQFRILWLRRHVSRRHNNNDSNSNTMKTKICSALAVAGGLAAGSLHAQGTISASATLTETGTSGSEFEYTLTLDNTGTVPINAFWYGWIQFAFDLPNQPTSITAPTGWTARAEGNSIQFGDSTGSPVAAGGLGTFTFDSTANPTAMTTGSNGGAPTGDSVAYSTVAAMNASDQSDPGIATGPFIPTLQAVPEPSTFGLLATGLAGMSLWRARRWRGE
jgi:hypothetical protein